MADPADFKEITTGCVEGDGVFDQLMRSLKAHLHEEYNANRIRGSEYSQVYLGGLQAAMGQAIQWHLGAQIAQNQADLILAQTNLTEEQVQNAIKEGLLTDSRKELIAAQASLTREQEKSLIEERPNIAKQGLQIEAQIGNIDSQKALTDAKIVSEGLGQETAQYNLDTTLPAQTVILEQKLITEEAQTKDITSQGVVTGAIGKRNTVMVKQAEGFDRDAEQKASRAIFDVWGMAIGSALDGEEIPVEAQTGPINEVIKHLRAGAGIDGAPD